MKKLFRNNKLALSGFLIARLSGSCGSAGAMADPYDPAVRNFRIGLRDPPGIILLETMS